jgi:hypothetical protein
VHVGAYSSPPGLNADGIDHITVSLNKGRASVEKALEENDRDEIMRQLNFALIHHVSHWTHHYPLARIREHVWQEGGKTQKEMDEGAGFFDINYQPSPLLKAVGDLPIFGDKAELAQYAGAHLLAEIDISGCWHPANRY